MWGTGILGTLAAGVGLMCYRRVPPNRALVVYGRTLLGLQNMKRVSTGGGSFVIPILQESSWLSFTPMPLEVSLKGALSLEKIVSMCRACSRWPSARTRRCSTTRRCASSA